MNQPGYTKIYDESAYLSKTYILSREDMLSRNAIFEKIFEFIEEKYEPEKGREILENIVDYQEGNRA